MPTPITKAQIAQLQNTIANIPASADTAVVNAALNSVYSTLYGAGFNYAGWATGVVNENTISGIAAIQYATGSALLGLGATQCINLTPQALEKLKQDMAERYLATLAGIAEATGTIDRDITAKEVWDMHKAAYLANGLQIESWTLNAVFTILQKSGGDAAVEKYWQYLLDTGGMAWIRFSPTTRRSDT